MKAHFVYWNDKQYTSISSVVGYCGKCEKNRSQIFTKKMNNGDLECVCPICGQYNYYDKPDYKAKVG
jgi:hypothetical protein